MNDKIKELAIQSLITVGDYSHSETIIDPEKFAKLIVKECTDILDTFDCQFEIETIKEHFGIE